MDRKSGGIHSIDSHRKAWKVVSWVVISLVIFLIVAYLGVSAYAANAFTQPQRNIDIDRYNPGVYSLDYEEFTLPARVDGLQIAAWYIPSEENQRVIILVHGYGNSRTNGFLDKFVSFASRLHDAGFSVMMIDLRGHGLSEDARYTFGVKERRDILGAVDWLEQRGCQADKIGVLGYSLGADSIVGAAAEEPDIGAVWVDSLFADIESVLDNGWTGVTELPKPFLYSTRVMIRLFYGYDIAASRPIDEIASIAPRPLFMAHCQNDNLIQISQMNQLLAVAQVTDTWLIPNCDIHTTDLNPDGFLEIFNNHAIGYPLNPDEYTQKVVLFFDQGLE
jgi:pimeloyl-ACP methyl ester carboxylesterase